MVFPCLIFTDNWKREEYNYSKLEHGKWELVIPPREDGSCAIPHNSIIKVTADLIYSISVDIEQSFSIDIIVQYGFMY